MNRTVGVEEEFLLVEAGTPRPHAVGDEVTSSARRAAPGFEHELKREQAELGTDPCHSTSDLADQLRERRALLSASAEESGARLAALATSPVPARPTTTDEPRYRRISEVFGQVAAPQLTCGMHVHVSIGSADEGIAVLDRLRPWWPVLVALSANSPFWLGADTSYASYRRVLWGQWPTAGVTEPFGDAAGYHRVTEQLVSSGAALDDGMIYFDARLSAKYPTVEVRVADVCPHADDAVVIAALIRALVSTAAADWAAGRPAPVVRSELLRAASWRAARWGVGGELVDPATAEPVPAWSLVQAMLTRLGPALAESGDAELVATGLTAIGVRGTGAQRQREVYARTGSLEAVVDAVVELTRS